MEISSLRMETGTKENISRVNSMVKGATFGQTDLLTKVYSKTE